MLGLRGLDHWRVSVYPSLEAAAAASARLEDMFGYGPGELAGALALIRDITGVGRLDELAVLARDAVAGGLPVP